MSLRRGALALIALAVNAVIMAVEMLATRLLFPFYGNTIFIWSSIISIVIAGLFLGYMAGGMAAERVKNRFGLVFAELLAAGAVVMFIPYLGDAFLFRLERAPALYPPLLGCFIVFGIPAGLMASVPPAIVGIWAEEGGGTASLASGAVSALAAFGSIAGTLLTTFYLIPEFGVRELFSGLGLCLGGAAALALWAGRGRQKTKSLGALAAFILLSASAARANAHPRRLLMADPVFSKDSMYQLVRVFEQTSGPSLLRVLMLDSTHEGAMRMDTREAVFEYTRAYKLFLNAIPKDVSSRVLFIGGGAYTMPIKVAEGLPRSSVEVAEIDPVVKEVGRRYFGAGSVSNLSTTLADGRQALRGRRGVYDGIFIDAYQGVMAIPFHLTTREFFTEVKGALRPEGFVSLNVIGNLVEKEGFFCSTIKTLSSVYPSVRAYGVDGTSASLQNIIIVASNSSEGLPGGDLALKGTGFAPGLAAAQLPCAKGEILTDNHAPVEWLVARYLGR